MLFKHSLERFLLCFIINCGKEKVLSFSAADLWLGDIQKSTLIKTQWWCGRLNKRIVPLQEDQIIFVVNTQYFVLIKYVILLNVI